MVLLSQITALSNNDLWNDDVHLLESGKIIIASNLIHSINHFLLITNQFVWNQ